MAVPAAFFTLSVKRKGLIKVSLPGLAGELLSFEHNALGKRIIIFNHEMDQQ